MATQQSRGRRPQKKTSTAKRVSQIKRATRAKETSKTPEAAPLREPPKTLLLTLAEAAELIGCSRVYINALIDLGELRSKPIGSHRRVVTASIYEWIERGAS